MNLLDLPGFAGTLVRASLEGGVFALAVWAILALVPRVPAALRCWLWWAVCLKFLVGLLALPGLELPLLPAGETALAPLQLAPVARVVPLATQSAPAFVAPSLAGILLGCWLAGVALALALLVRDALRARRLVAGSRLLGPSSLTQLFSELCQRFRLRSASLLASPDLVSPQVLGVTSPRVLLPETSLTRLSTSELAMALAHELAHVVRGDLVLGWVPALCRRIFFFHPLAALATREYALAREAACDAEVLRVLGSAPQSYGRFLLQWGVVPRETGLAAAAAAPSLRLLKRRLSMLEHTTPLSTTGRVAWWFAAAAVVAAGLIPLKLVAQSHRPSAPPPAPVPAVAPVAAPNPVAAPSPVAAPRAVAATAPTPPTPPAPPAPPPPPPAKGSRSSYAYSTGGDDGRSWVYLSDDQQTVMSGSYEEYKKVKKRFGGDGPIFYFSEGGKQYVIRDKALLAEIERLYEPVQKLGAQQGELGSKQGEFGGKQGEIGAQQGALGAKQGALGARIGELAARHARGDESVDLDAEMEKLSAEMDRLSAEMDKLSEPMEALGREMEVYGEQMEALGEQMEAASEKAEREMGALVKRALAQGLAEEVK